MIEYICWDRINDATNAFMSFLNQAIKDKTTYAEYHVIFSMGTVARLNLDSCTEFTGYTGEYVESYPTERIDEHEEAI
jgi:hypothetical protein